MQGMDMLSAFQLSMGEKYLAVLENLQRKKSKSIIERNTKGGQDCVEIISDVSVISHHHPILQWGEVCTAKKKTKYFQVHT